MKIFFLVAWFSGGRQILFEVCETCFIFPDEKTLSNIALCNRSYYSWRLFLDEITQRPSSWWTVSWGAESG